MHEDRQAGGRVYATTTICDILHTQKKFFHNIYRHHKHQFVIFSCSLSSSSLANISFNFLDGLVFEFVVHNKIILSTGIFTVFRCTCRIILFSCCTASRLHMHCEWHITTCRLQRLYIQSQCESHTYIEREKK